MKAITPAKLIPPDQSTAASGTLPTEQTKLRIGDQRADEHVLDRLQRPAGASVTKRKLKKSLPSRPMKPASRKPIVISFQSICQSPRKLPATVRPGRGRGQPLAPARARLARGHVVLVAACRPRWACSRACSSSRGETKKRSRPPPSARSARSRRRTRRARTASRSGPRGRGRAPRRGWSRRTGRRAPWPPRRPSGTATWRSRSPRRSRRRRRRRARSPSPPGRRRGPRGRLRSARAAPRPGRSPRSRSRGPAPTRPRRPSAATVRIPCRILLEDVTHAGTVTGEHRSGSRDGCGRFLPSPEPEAPARSAARATISSRLGNLAAAHQHAPADHRRVDDRPPVAA